MGKILITGATGNVGGEVVKALIKLDQPMVAAVAKQADLLKFPEGQAVVLDFMDSATWQPALTGVDRVFLMRPPAISDVKTYLFPFIDAAVANGVKQITFLSLQGVSFNPLTPHYKVEKYLKKIHAPYTFVRPNFFMQNLSTFYKNDILTNDEIFLPAGKGRTAFVDVRDIGSVVAKTLSEAGHMHQAYTLSGQEALDYYQVSAIMSQVLGRTITYQNPSVKEYVARLRTLKTDESFIKVQKMLYFVVRHNFSSGTSQDISRLLGRPPIAFKQFCEDYADNWKN